MSESIKQVYCFLLESYLRVNMVKWIFIVKIVYKICMTDQGNSYCYDFIILETW
jgi:hypothetical protein